VKAGPDELKYRAIEHRKSPEKTNRCYVKYLMRNFKKLKLANNPNYSGKQRKEDSNLRSAQAKREQEPI
jgi:hypothetical protein